MTPVTKLQRYKFLTYQACTTSMRKFNNFMAAMEDSNGFNKTYSVQNLVQETFKVLACLFNLNLQLLDLDLTKFLLEIRFADKEQGEPLWFLTRSTSGALSIR